MRTKVGVLATWLILAIGIAGAVIFRSPFWFLVPMASLAVRRYAGLAPISRPGDIWTGLVIIFVLICMWIDLLFHFPGWLRSAAQVAFMVVLFTGIAVMLYRDIRILIAPQTNNTDA